MYNKVSICGVDTSKLPILKESDKMELLKKARTGNKYAREGLINGNLRLVLSVIKRFAGRGENLDDLFQVGCVGLIKELQSYVWDDKAAARGEEKPVKMQDHAPDAARYFCYTILPEWRFAI